MEYGILGNTGIKVSRLCFGALTIGPLQRNLPLADGAAIIEYAVAQGVNFIDTADLYKTYPYIRKFLQDTEADVIIATKSYDYTREGMEQSLERARREMNRDVIDIFLLHEQESDLTIKGHWPAFEYLLEAKARGIVRALGISTHHVAGVRAAKQIKEIEIIHPLVNIDGIGIADGTAEEMLREIRDAAAAGKGIYGMKPLGGGHLHKRVPEALGFMLSQDCLHSIAMGMYTREEVDMNIRLFRGEQVPEKVAMKAAGVPKELYVEEWCQGCGRCASRCPADALQLKDSKVVINRQKCFLCGYCGAVCPDFCLKII